MQRPIICKGKIYAKTYNMQGAKKYTGKRPILCKGEIYAKKDLYAKTYNMQGQNICKDL